MITHLIKAPKLTDTTGNIDLGHIELFRDHEDPFKFYYLNNTPRLQFDQITKRPVFDYTKILQKSGIQKNEVIELIYRGFI